MSTAPANESSIPVGDTGDLLRTFIQVVDGVKVHVEATTHVDPVLVDEVARVRSDTPEAGVSGLVVRPVVEADAPLPVTAGTGAVFPGQHQFLDQSLLKIIQKLAIENQYSAAAQIALNLSNNQLPDSGNSAFITSASATGNAPGNPLVGVNFATTVNGVQECVSILTAFDSSGNPIPDLGFTFTFRGNPEGIVRTVTLPNFTAKRLLHTTDWLSNQWTNYQVEMEPSRPLVAGETIVIATRHSKQSGNKFLFPLDYDFLEDVQTAGTIQAFVRSLAHADTNNSTLGVVLPPYLGTPFLTLANFGGPLPTVPADTFLGSDWTSAKDFSAFSIDALASQPGQGWAIWSTDGGATISRFETTPFFGAGAFTDPPQGSTHLLIAFQNQSASACFFKANTQLRYQPQSLFMSPVVGEVNPLFPAGLVKSVGAGQTPDAIDDPYTTPIVAAKVQGRHTLGSTTTPLAANAHWRGKWFPWQSSYVKAVVDCFADQAGTLMVEFSQELTPINVVSNPSAASDPSDASITGLPVIIPYDPEVDELVSEHFAVKSKWVRMHYENEDAAQAVFGLDLAFTVTDPGGTTKSSGRTIIAENLSTITDAITTSRTQESTDVDPEYVQDRATLNTTTGNRGKNFHLTGVDVGIGIAALPDITDTGRFTASVNDPVQLPAPITLNPQTVQIINLHTESTVSIGTLLKLAAGQGHALLPQVPIELDYNGQANLPWFTVDAGSAAAAATTDRFGTGTANNVGVLNPGNLNANDGSFATFDALTDSVDITGITAALTFPTISSVKVSVKGAKGTNQTTEQVTFTEAVIGNAGAVGSVTTSSNVTAGTLKTHLAFISREVSSATNGEVQGVTIAGLTATKVGNTKNSDDDNRRIDLWRAFGTGVTGVATATFATTPTSSRIAVISCDGSSAVQATNGTNGNSASVVGPALAGTDRGLSVMGVAINNTTSTATGGYTESTDDGGTTGTTNNLTTLTKAITATGTETATCTISASKHYAAIGATLTPAPAYDPVYRVRTKIGGVISGTAALFTFSSTSQGELTAVDITGDRTWTSTVLADTDLVVDVSSIGAATIVIDSARLTVTETETSATAPMSYMYIGGGNTP